MKRKIKVHIADDHEVVIEGVIALLNTEEDIEVEGYSLSGKDVLEWSKSNKVDVLILDINMPEVDGINVLKTFKHRNNSQKTIILSGLSDAKIAQKMMDLGAYGFIEKGSASEHIIKAIKTVNNGIQYFSDDIKKELESLHTVTSKEENVKKVELNERELAIIRLITEEKSSAQIGKILLISEKTVESHRRKLFKKLNVKNVVGLAMYAVKNDIV